MSKKTDPNLADSELLSVDYTLESYLQEFTKLLIKGKKNILIRGLTPLCLAFLKKIEKFKTMYEFKFFLQDKDPLKSLPKNTVPYNSRNNIDAVIIFIVISLDRVLEEFEGKPGITCIAPNTDSYKSVIPLSVPKAGTFLIENTLHVLGYQGQSETLNPKNKEFIILGGTRHLTVDHLLNLSGMERQLFFNHPSLFIYRDPRDVLLSLFHWIIKDPQNGNNVRKLISRGNTKKGMFTLFLQWLLDTQFFGEQLLSLAKWFRFKKYNLLPIRFEDIVGLKGGGNIEAQIKILWKIQLRLHAEGKTKDLAEKVFSLDSPTFFKGQAGSYQSFYTSEHFELFEKFNTTYGDLLKKFGYN